MYGELPSVSKGHLSMKRAESKRRTEDEEEALQEALNRFKLFTRDLGISVNVRSA